MTNKTTRKTKLQKNWRTSVMLAGVVLPMATGLATVNADDASKTENSAKKSDQGISLAVDHKALDDAVKQAKAAGVNVKQGETSFELTNQADLSKKQKNIAASYQDQISKLDAATKQQAEDNKTHTDDKSKWEAEQAAYKKAIAEYDKNEAAYQKAKAAYDKSIADQKANAHKDGFATEPLVQALQLKAEGHAQVSVASPNDLTYTVNGKSQKQADINPKSDFRNNPNSGKNASGEQVEFYETALKKGENVTFTYDKLANSSYNGRKITKLVRSIAYVSNGSDAEIGMAIANDPTVGFWYIGGHANSGSFERSVKVSDKYFYEDGSVVSVSGDDAKISAGSLNNYYGGTENEHIERVQPENATFVAVNGSTITDNNGVYYAKKDNSTGADNGPKADDWDKNTAPNRYIGAGIYGLKNGTTEFNCIASTVESANDGGKKNKTTWFTISTTLPVETALVPPVAPQKPTQPTTPEPQLKHEDASYQLTELVYTPTPAKDVKAGKVNGNTAESIDKKEVKVGDELTYTLTANDLPKDRTGDLKTLIYQDALPAEVDYESATATTKDGKTDLSKYLTFNYDKQTRQFTAKVSDTYLKEINQPKNAVKQLPVINVHVKANKANVTFKNQYNLLFNQGKFQSNMVENKTGETPKTPEKPNKPTSPNTPNTSYGEKPKGGLYASLAALGLIGILFVFWKPIKNWFNK
ncbi:GbpC/Spa domain-containing protein [Leuconostoc citreum]|uniref:GbpC/Spa domain-containing protein n=1 Tax=Leuconostoc citreum TaxID=33964 RepID=UPI0032DFDD7F